MNSRSKYLVKNVGILTLSNFASKILVFLLVPLYTSVLTTDDVGVYDLIVSTVSLLFPVLTLNIVDGVMRFSMDTTKPKNEIIAVAIRYLGLSYIVGLIIIVLIRACNAFPKINGLECYIFVYFVFYILYHFLLQFAKGLERVADMGIAGVVATIVMLGGNILLLLVFKLGLKGFFLAYTLAQVLPAIYLFVRLEFWKYLKRIKINTALQKEMLVYSVPLIATTLGWWINSTSDKYTVAIMVGVSANGLLSIAYKIPQIINTLQGIFIHAWQISAIKEYGEKDSSLFYGCAFKTINVLMCAACTWLIILTRPLGRLLYQKGFYEAWKYVPFLLISCVINSASGFLGPILSAKKDSRSMALSAIYGASANIILNIVFIHLIGIQGATIATVIATIIIYIVRKRAVKNEIKIERYGIVIITWALLCVQACFEILFPSLQWVEAVLMFFMLCINYTELKTVLSMGRGILQRRSI